MKSEEATTNTTAPAPSNNQPLLSLARSFSWEMACLALILILAICVSLWKPWQATVKASERVISVSGDATIKAQPDEFVFSPTYDFTNADKQAALSEMTAKSDEIVTKLKSLGIASSQIKTSTSGYKDMYYPMATGGNTYNLLITVTASSQAQAQKVQDYLVTTGPSGSVSPQANFSTSLQKSLESRARDTAEKDARAKAEQSAKNLGFTVDKVKSVDDSGFSQGGCGGLCAGANATSSAQEPMTSLSVQPGENELPYSIKVTYYIH